MAAIVKRPLRKTTIRGVEVDADLANETFTDDIMDEMAEKKGTETVSFKSLFSVFMMFIPAMIGVMATMLAAMWLELLQLIGNYTVLDLLNYQLACYISAPIGIMLSIVFFLLVKTWAQGSFEGIVVLRLTGRNASGSKTVNIDYMGHMPKPMKKPTIAQLGPHFGAYLQEQVYQMHRGIPEEEIRGNLQRMQDRIALAYQKQIQKAQLQKMTTLTQSVEVVMKDENGKIIMEDGKPKTETIQVQVPVFRPKVSRKRRTVLFLIGSGMVLFSIWGVSMIVFLWSGGTVDIWKTLFDWIPWW